MPRGKRSTIRSDPGRRTRWTAEEAGRVLRALEASGLSRKEFCEREGLIPERLRRWQRKLERWGWVRLGPGWICGGCSWWGMIGRRGGPSSSICRRA